MKICLCENFARIVAIILEGGLFLAGGGIPELEGGYFRPTPRKGKNKDLLMFNAARSWF
jgi:hypothetical protein